MTTKQPSRARRAPAIRESVEHVWLAGLGALALAEEEGSKLYSNLVRKGEILEKESRTRLRKISARAEGVRDDVRASTIGRLGAGVDDAMTSVLHRLGVPTSREIASLTRRVETLTERLAGGQASPARRPRTAAAATAGTRAAKKTRTTRRAVKPRTTPAAQG